MESYAQVLSYAIPGFVLLIALESIFARWKGMQVNTPMDTISSLSSGVTNTLKALLGIGIVIVSYTWLERHLGVFDIKSSLLLYVLAFIGHDFAGYWSHRFNHVFNVFWNRHIIHHSSEEFNLSCALRQEISAFVGVYFVLYTPMAVLGIPPDVVAVVAPLHLFAQFWYHTRVINKMGFLEHIIVTPSHHRVHHAINPEYIDKNFSEIFILWDKWFGTFQPELEDVPAVYGTKRPAGTWNPIIINFMHLAMLFRDALYTKRWWDKIRIWFMPTGWRPEDVRARFPVDSIDDVWSRKKYDSQPSRLLIGISWVQLVFVNVLLYVLMTQLGSLNASFLVWTVLFFFVAIFAYTSLMDGHWMAIPAEILKLFMVGFIAMQFGGFSIFNTQMISGTYLMTIYAVISTCFTVYILWQRNALKLNRAL